MDKVIFLLFVLPFLIIQEAYTRFGKQLKSKEVWDKAPYILLIFLIIVFLGLLARGYRLF